MIDHSPSSNGGVGQLTPSASTARMTDGTILRTLHWPIQGEPWAVALIVHGIGEHAGRYATVADALAADRIDVRGYDHRGFGASAGPRAYVQRWSQLHDDLQEMVTATRAERPDLPLILWGHSMGGLIACGYLLAPVARPLPDLLVLSSPALDATVPAWKKQVAAVLAGALPRMRLSNGAVAQGLTHDTAIETAYAGDPLRIGSTTVRFAHEGFQEQARVQAAIAAIDAMPVPTYVFHGSADPVVPVEASAALGAKRNVIRHVHEGLLHETHHEPERTLVLAEAVAWLDAQHAILAARSSVADGPGNGRAAAGV
jgi:alpha-beta hydrolase superfamily lysophospholipase